VRQAQTYGTSVREFNGGFGAQSYGVYFNTGSPTSYILFADADNDGAYDSDERVQIFTLGQGYTINNLCGTTGSTDTCFSSLVVYFKRPNPDAIFNPAGSTYASAYIQVRSPGGETRRITVYKTGQITVGALGS
jgi:hypothetical protein